MLVLLGGLESTLGKRKAGCQPTDRFFEPRVKDVVDPDGYICFGVKVARVVCSFRCEFVDGRSSQLLRNSKIVSLKGYDCVDDDYRGFGCGWGSDLCGCCIRRWKIW